MKTNKVIFLILGIDSHLPRIKKCISTIDAVYDNTNNFDIGISTFGEPAIPRSILLEEYAKENKYLFFDSERQDFLKDPPMTGVHPSHELVGNLTISKHFYDLGYDEVYLFHNDMYIVRDFLPLYRSKMKDKWSLVAQLLISKKEKVYTTIDKIKSLDGLKRTGDIPNARVAQALMIINKKLVQKLFRVYGNQENLYKNFLYKYNNCGDIAQLQLFDDFFGFNGGPIPAATETMIDLSWTACGENMFSPSWDAACTSRIIDDDLITHLHGAEIYNRCFKNIQSIIKRIKNK